MAADTHVTGEVILAAGKSVTNIRKIIATIPDDVADNAAGSEAPYLIPSGARITLPSNDGEPIDIAAGPHLLPGELLFLGVKHNGSLADVDTTGATSDVYNLTMWEKDMNQPGKPAERISIVDETSRNTTTGIAPATDPKLINGQIVWTHAWGPVPPGCLRTVAGRVRIDLRTAA